MKFTSSMILAFCTFVVVNSLPLDHDKRIVYSPTITSPEEGDFWVVGQNITVTWDNEGAPTGKTGTLYLGYRNGHRLNEHLDLNHPLASGFSLSDGAVTFLVPLNTPLRHNAIVVLKGDSGNASPKFNIVDGWVGTPEYIDPSA